MKKKVHKLAIKPQYDFALIGISSHEKDYFISWSLNKSCGFSLVKMQGLTFSHPKTGIQYQFSMYEFNDEEKLINWRLISNRCDNGFLADEWSNIDYYIHCGGEYTASDIEETIVRIRQAMGVIAVFRIDPEKMKSGNRFILD